MSNLAQQIQVLINDHKKQLKAEIINHYFKHPDFSAEGFTKYAISRVSGLNSTWGGGFCPANLVEQAEKEVWLEMAQDAQFYIA
jgi:hypothetical protein